MSRVVIDIVVNNNATATTGRIDRGRTIDDGEKKEGYGKRGFFECHDAERISFKQDE